MAKRLSALFLTVILITTMSISTFAADLTLEDKINAMTLSPIQTDEWPADLIAYFNDVPAYATNYQKLRSKVETNKKHAAVIREQQS